MKTITFDGSESAKRVILALTGKTVDSEGYVVEVVSGERVVTPHNEELTLENFAGVRPGSEVFITNDLPSLLEQAEYIKAA
ncbi:MAG TPA: hypothetical protein VFT87_02825 [Candidatus Saccharimonadales bacterium]|nr:hypothetical protein [Candidatus Saccharimonadales bacterium]